MFGFDSYIALVTIASLVGGPEALGALLIGVGAGTVVGLRALATLMSHRPWWREHPLLAAAGALAILVGVVGVAMKLRHIDLSKARAWLDARVRAGELTEASRSTVLGLLADLRATSTKGEA